MILIQFYAKTLQCVYFSDPPDVKVYFTDGRMTCTASSYPEKLSYLYMEHESYFGEHIRYINLNSTFEVLMERYDDSGRYICTASNGIADKNGHVNMTADIYLVIKVAPVFVPENKLAYQASIGQPQLMEVDVYCHPSCYTVFWMVTNGTNFPLPKTYKHKAQTRTIFHRAKVTVNVQRVSLLILELKESDFKQYTVIAENAMGMSYLTVNLEENTKGFPLWYIFLVTGIAIVVAMFLIILKVCFGIKKCCSKNIFSVSTESNGQGIAMDTNDNHDYESIIDEHEISEPVTDHRSHEPSDIHENTQQTSNEQEEEYLHMYNVLMQGHQIKESERHLYKKMDHLQQGSKI